MNQSLRIVYLLVAFCSGLVATAKDGNEDPINSNSPIKPKVYSKNRAFMPAQNLVSPQILASVERQIEGLERLNYNVAFSPSAAFLADMPISATAGSARDTAKAIMDKVINGGYLLDGDVANAPPLQPVKLPIGIKKHFGQNNIVYLAFSKAVIKPTHAEITAFVKMEMYVADGQTGTKKKKEIYFGASGIKLTNNGKIVGDARLVLLGDYTLPMFNGKMKLVLKGGELSEADGGIVGGDRTYAIIDCNGFREAAITADAIFDRKVMTPLDAATLEPQSGQVTAHMRIEGGVTDLNDILGKMSFETPFAITGHERWGFEVDNMFFDASLRRNYTGITMLDEYLQKFPEEEGAGAWKGFGLNSFKLFLPKEFKKDDGTTHVRNNRVFLEVQKLLIDNEGVSCNVGGGVTTFPIDEGKTKDQNAWRMSVNSFYLTFERSKLVGGKFGGQIRLPVSKENEVNNNYVYNATIDFRGNYSLKVNPLQEIDFAIFKATAHLAPTSYVELAVVKDQLTNDYEFRPKASLTGFFEIGHTEIKKEGSSATPVANQKTKQQVSFQELELTTVKPFISLKYAGYNRRSEVANFPVSVDNFNVSITASPTGLPSIVLGGGMSLNLMGENQVEPVTENLPDGSTRPTGETTSTPQGFGVKTILRVKADLKVRGTSNIQYWDFREMTITPAGLNATLGKYKFVGELEPFDDGSRGKGFKASIQFSKKEKGDYELMGAFLAMFGNKKDDPSADVSAGTRYWIVEAFANVKVAQLGPVELKGIGGGVYHHLYPCGSCGESAAILTSNTFGDGVKYSLNKNIKLGFKVVTGIKLPATESFKGLVGFEITFNNNWGINSVGLFGNATMAAKFRGLEAPDFMNTIKNKFTDLATRATSSPVGAVLSKSKLIEKANSEFNGPAGNGTTAAEGQISLKVSILYQREKDELHGDGEVFINGGPVINGIGTNGRAGWFALHFDPKEWYVHAGSPSDRIGVKMGLGIAYAKATTYFMIGHRIPPMPSPPPAMLSLLGPNYSAAPVNSRDNGEVASGRGVAFGAELGVSTGDLRAAIFYARLEAGVGFDAMLSKGNHNCTGLDGWYARGQAYAYVSGEVGITVKVGFVRKNVPILSAGAGVLLQVGMPHPSWFRGTVAGRYNVLGGLAKGDFSIKMAIGEECGATGVSNPIVSTPPNQVPEDYDGDTPITQPAGSSSLRVASNVRATAANDIATPLILSVSPRGAGDVSVEEFYTKYQLDSKGKIIPAASNDPNGYTQVTTVYNSPQSVFINPTITFNRPVMTPFEGLNATTGAKRVFRVNVTSATLKEKVGNGNQVAINLLWSKAKEMLTLQPVQLLKENTEYTYTTTAVLEELIGSSWVAVTDNGRIDILDTRSIDFKTGKVVNEIPSDNIAYTYPVINQKYFYKGESSVGYVKLRRSQQKLKDSIATETSRRFVRFTSTSGAKIQVPFTIDGDSINFAIPTGLINNQKYKVQFIAWFKYNDGQVIKYKKDSTVLLSYEFGVSKYNTIQEKLNSATNERTFAYKGAKSLMKDVVLLNANANYGEPFDEIETRGNNYSGGSALLLAKALLTENYNAVTINNLLYKDGLFNTYYPALSSSSKLQSEVFVSDWYVHNQKWETSKDSVLKRTPFVYSLTSLYKEDFDGLKNVLAEKYYSDQTFKNSYNSNSALKSRTDGMLASQMPYLENGTYTISIASKLSGNRALIAKKNFAYQVSGLIDDRDSNQPPVIFNGAEYVSQTFPAGPLKTVCPAPLDKLIATAKILSGAMIRMYASLEITLDEGFETSDDADFEADIQPCTKQ